MKSSLLILEYMEDVFTYSLGMIVFAGVTQVPDTNENYAGILVISMMISLITRIKYKSLAVTPSYEQNMTL